MESTSGPGGGGRTTQREGRWNLQLVKVWESPFLVTDFSVLLSDCVECITVWLCWAPPLPRFLDCGFTSVSIRTPFTPWVVYHRNTLINTWLHTQPVHCFITEGERMWLSLEPEKDSAGHSLSCDLVEARLPALQRVRTGRNENTGPCAFSISDLKRL